VSVLAGVVELIPAEGVPRATVLAAECALDVACRDLGLSRPELRWFREFRAPLGFVHREEPAVYLRSDLFPNEAYEIGLHEVRHHWQHLHRVYAGDRDGAERDAVAFADRMIRHYPGIVACFRSRAQQEAR
jgi:hypothetical protein